ncbi:UPF0122 protein [Syntrophobotulus glycolicus DSM 8271]|uniref:UPF0122 protein Sgly_2307 n=1 Tax=Syntrophobotulus glycolicus (strain DSM 8271 / FlGlyR) TaxID=645991 RepID=F0SUE5_SYNGF|nr:putative DNA-binding protein [Syntrophobotulus glycolicus]ADY56595.1 UPF0122 protein [Syntrophobotulus glycolicus DSM 8271]
MKDLARRAFLFDFYGPLLTEKQSRIWDLYYNLDYSLAEIAEGEEISRQAVHDLLKRTEKILNDYESKLLLVQKFEMEREKLARIEALLQSLERESFCSEEGWMKKQDIGFEIKQMISDTLK